MLKSLDGRENEQSVKQVPLGIDCAVAFAIGQQDAAQPNKANSP